MVGVTWVTVTVVVAVTALKSVVSVGVKTSERVWVPTVSVVPAAGV